MHTMQSAPLSWCLCVVRTSGRGDLLPSFHSLCGCATKGIGNTLVLCTDLRAFLQDNIQLGKLPVAISSEAAFQNCEAYFFI